MEPDADADADADAEGEEMELLPATFVVRGPRGETPLHGVEGLVVGEHGELIITRGEGDCLAIFAPGAWTAAVRVEDGADA